MLFPIRKTTMSLLEKIFSDMSKEKNKERLYRQQHHATYNITPFERGTLRTQKFTDSQIDTLEQLIRKGQTPLLDEKHRRRLRFLAWQMDRGKFIPGKD